MEEQELQAQQTTMKYTWWSLAAGLIPVPLADFAAMTGIQVKMVYELSKIYGVPFQKSRVKSLVGALVGGIAPQAVGPALGSAVRMVPLVGTVAGMLTFPAASAASTYAVGKVFTQHFASGGTFLDFNPDTVRGFFVEQFEAGKLLVKKVATDVQSAAGRIANAVEPETGKKSAKA